MLSTRRDAFENKRERRVARHAIMRRRHVFFAMARPAGLQRLGEEGLGTPLPVADWIPAASA